MSLIDRELNEVWDALRASRGQRDEALEEVRITNLRAIDDLRIPFDYPVSVLAGPNGSGKSTVLFACACAYRVPGRRSGHFAPGRLFPNFTSRQEAVRSDPVPETQLEFHYLHDDDRHSMILKRGKSWSRSGFQPEREVYLRTLANLTSPSEVRSILQLGRKQVQAEAISPELLIFAHRILPWRYRNLDLISGRSSRDLLFAEIEGTDETQYSEFHMSSGERTIVRISKDISGLDNAVVLIDEVDTGMHPYTQRQAMLELQRSALRQKLQIIVASHSPVVLDSVPPEGRIFLDRDQETGKVQRVPLYRDIFQKALYGQSQDRLSILCEDEVAEGVIRGVLEVLNIEMGLRHEDIVVGRNTGRNEFPGHVRTLAKFGKLSDFILVLDGDSREMENDLKAVAGEYGHALQPLFLPGDASPEQWLWGILRIRPGEYADAFGLAEADMRHKTDRVEHLVEGAVQQRDAAKTCMRAFADDIRRTVPEIARNVGRNEAKNNEIPEFLHALKDQIIRWRRF